MSDELVQQFGRFILLRNCSAGFWTFSNNFGWFWTSQNNSERCLSVPIDSERILMIQNISNDYAWIQTILNDSERFRMVRDDCVRFWTILNDTEGFWTFPTILDNAGQVWTKIAFLWSRNQWSPWAEFVCNRGSNISHSRSLRSHRAT